MLAHFIIWWEPKLAPKKKKKKKKTLKFLVPEDPNMMHLGVQNQQIFLLKRVGFENHMGSFS